MKFEVGDEVDQALTVTMSHEMLLCQDSFERFSLCARQNINGQRDKATRILLYSYYARFLHHLYEFYVACYQRDEKTTASVQWQRVDKLLNGEVRKLLKNRISAIEGGYTPSWENHRSAYEVPVPEEFSEQWRKIRNRTAHVSIERSAAKSSLSLVTFYKKYHQFVYLLYDSALSHWQVRNIESLNWKEIEDFNLAIEA